MQQQGAGAIGEGVNIGPWRKRWVSSEDSGDVVVGAVDVVIFARQDAVQPVKHVLLDGHRGGDACRCATAEEQTREDRKSVV